MSEIIKQIPPAKSLIDGIRSIGYNFSTSVADIIDNSIAARASEIKMFSDPLSIEPYFCIVDNGIGMDYDELLNAMTFGSDRSNKVDNIIDLGRFGLGLKAASLSQCRLLIVATKKDNKIIAMSYDLKLIEEKNDWVLKVLSNEEICDLPRIEFLDKYETGTIVIWEKFDKIEGLSKRFEDSFRTCVDEAKKHVELVFHRFYNKVSIYLNEVRIEKRDPFLLSSPKQQTGRTDNIEMNGSIITVTPYVLPFANDLTLEEKRLLGNPKSIYDEQGFYLYRNERLIVWGSWLHMNIRSEQSKLARVKIDIPSNLDMEWSLDVKKSTAKIPDKIKELIKASIEDSAIRSKKAVRFPGIKEQSYDNKIWNRRILRENVIMYNINQDNPLLKELNLRLDEDSKNMLKIFLAQVESGLPKYSIQNDTIDNKNILNNTDYESREELKEQILNSLSFVKGKDAKETLLKRLLSFDVYQSIKDMYDEILKEVLIDE